MIPLITTTNTFTFSGRFSTVGFSTGTDVTLFGAVLDAALALLEDVGVGSTRLGRLVVTAAITFNMVVDHVSDDPRLLHSVMAVENAACPRGFGLTIPYRNIASIICQLGTKIPCIPSSCSAVFAFAFAFASVSAFASATVD